MTGLGLVISYAWAFLCLGLGSWLSFQLPRGVMLHRGIFAGWSVLIILFVIIGLMAISRWDNRRIKKMILRLLADGRELKDCDISRSVHALIERVGDILRQLEEDGVLSSRKTDSDERICGLSCCDCPCRVYRMRQPERSAA